MLAAVGVMADDFRSICVNIGKKFRQNRNIKLSPEDLYRLAVNMVTVAPSDLDFYETVLVCKVCECQFQSLQTLIDHCKSAFHRQNLYRNEIKQKHNPKLETPSWSESSESGVQSTQDEESQGLVVPDRAVITAIKERSDGVPFGRVLQIFRACQPVKYFTCELCQICLGCIEAFLLHLTGYGHKERRNRLREESADYFQAFHLPDSAALYYLNFRDNTLHGDLQPVNHLMFGYTGVSEISSLSRQTLQRFIHLVDM